MRWSRALVLALGMVACGGNDGGGMAGAPPAGPLALGEVCRGGLECQSGLICSRSAFFDQCSVQCINTSGCQLLDSRAQCYGGECGIGCMGAGRPEGTTCVAVPGGMACKAK